MKKIFLSQRTVREERYGETRDALDQRWHRLCEACGLLPVLLPNHAPTAKRLVDSMPDVAGFLMTGGNDSGEREAAEHFTLQHMIDKKLPVFGVCHGMQVIQRHFGVAVDKVPGHVAHAMEITIEGKPATVNSYHNLGARQTVPELEIWAQASDGVIKAVRHTSLPLVGIMWHPERCDPFGADDIARIRRHFSA